MPCTHMQFHDRSRAAADWYLKAILNGPMPVCILFNEFHPFQAM